MPDYYFPEINTNGQFTDPKVIAEIETRAKNALATALAGKRNVEPVELGTEHLDTVTTPDVYSQSSNLESTLESGYPSTRGGLLIVERSAFKSMVWQTYIPYTPTATTPQREFRRSYYQGNWTAWTEMQTMAWEAQALTTENLDTVTAPRVYTQSTSSGATLELNYPVKWAGILEVTANNSRNIVRQVYRPYFNNQVQVGETWTRSMYNSIWSAWERSDGGAILPAGSTANQVLTAGSDGKPKWGPVLSPTSHTLTGPGRPDVVRTTAGSITGTEPVGTEYRSTDGAQVGAWVWRKRTGDKWEVVDGDTGWRDITPTAVDPAASQPGGKLFVRRMSQSLVTLRVLKLAPLVADGVPVVENEWLNVGFRNNGTVTFYLTDIGRGESKAGVAARLPPAPWWKYARPLKINTATAADANGETTFTTTDPWPTAPLPGNPV